MALLGDNGLALGKESLYTSGTGFPEDQLKLDLNLKDISFYKDGSLFGYGTTLGRIDLESGTFNSFGISIPGFARFVKCVPPLNLLEVAGSQMVAYPNPLRESLTVLFELKEPAAVTLEVYSINGQKTVSIDTEFTKPGATQITWNGRDAAGNRMKEGMYILKLVVNNKLHAVQRLFLEP